MTCKKTVRRRQLGRRTRSSKLNCQHHDINSFLWKYSSSILTTVTLEIIWRLYQVDLNKKKTLPWLSIHSDTGIGLSMATFYEQFIRDRGLSKTTLRGCHTNRRRLARAGQHVWRCLWVQTLSQAIVIVVATELDWSAWWEITHFLAVMSALYIFLICVNDVELYLHISYRHNFARLIPKST